MSNFKKTRIPKFRRFVLQNFPFIEEDFDALTDYGLICKVVEYLNDVIESTNESSDQVATLTTLYNELKSYVDNYFDNLDVQDEINNKIDELVESGEIEGYINRAATTETLGGIIVGDNLDVDENGRLSTSIDGLKKEGFVDGGKHVPEYILTRYRQTGTSTTFDATVPREMEGIVYTGTDKVVVTYRPSTVTTTSNVLIEEISYADPTSPSILRSNTITGIGSSNNMCYNPTTGKIHATVGENTLAIIDYTTLTLTGTINIPGITLISGVAYDAVNDKYYVTEGLHVWELDISTLSTTLLFTFPNNTIKNGFQGFDIRNGKFYFALSHPESIVVADVAGNIERIMNIDEYDNAGHLAAYIADLTFIDDNNLLITPHIEGDYVEMTRSKSSYYVNYICRVNINGDNFETSPIAGGYTSKELYLDTSLISDGVRYAIGSSTYKLPLLSEYMNSRYKKVFGFRCNAVSPVIYRGTMVISDEDLVLTTALEMEGGSIRGGSITATQGISVKSARITTYGTLIKTPTLKLGYNETSDKNTFIVSSLIVKNITDLEDVEANAVYSLSNSSKMPLNCDVLFSNDTGASSGITLGDIRSYKKVKIYVLDNSAQQDSKEILVRSGQTNIFTFFSRWNQGGTTYATELVSRVTIAQATGVVTIDREYQNAFTPTPTLAMTENTGRLLITRVEGYY